MKLATALLLFAAAVLISCQREPYQINELTPDCRITTGIYLGGGGMYDSATFRYDANGNIIKWEGMEGYYDYVCGNGKIIARKFYDGLSNELWYVDSVKYDANGQITEMVFYDYSMTWGFDTIHTKTLISYANNKMATTRSIEFYDWGGGPMSDTLLSSFVWNAAGNIERVVYHDEFGIAYDSAIYQFDAHPNYFSSLHPHFFLLDPGFELQVGLEANFPYYYSRNNVTNINIYGTWDYPIDYGLDSLNKVTSLDMGGFEYMKYKYECP